MRVAIADDSIIVREGLARVLADRQIDVVGMAGDAEELLRLIAVEEPDVAIVDIRMPPTQTDEGLVAADSIREQFPDVSVLVLSQYTDAAYALRLLAGDDRACGYLLKDRIAAIDELVEAIERVGAGECVVDRDLVQLAPREPRRARPTCRSHPTRARRAGTDRRRVDRSWHRRTTLAVTVDRRDARPTHPAQARATHGNLLQPASGRSPRLPRPLEHKRGVRIRPRFQAGKMASHRSAVRSRVGDDRCCGHMRLGCGSGGWCTSARGLVHSLGRTDRRKEDDHRGQRWAGRG